MFGTVARMQVKPGGDVMLNAWMNVFTVPMKGHVSTTIYKARDEERTFWLTVVFENEAAYRANAESPEQHRRWQQLRSVLEGDPEWHDGDVISHGVRRERA